MSTDSHPQQRQSGAILVISLIVLGVMVLVGVYLATLLTIETRSTRYTDSGIVGYYVAESGAEEALWRLTRARERTDVSQAATDFRNTAGSVRCAGEGTNTSNSASTDVCTDPERLAQYDVVSLTSGSFVAYNLEKNRVTTFDLYDPTQDKLVGGTGTGVNQFSVEWFLDTCSSSAKIEISYTPISYLPISDTTTQPVTVITPCTCSTAVNGLYSCGEILVPLASAVNYYRVNIRSLDTSVAHIEARGWNCSGTCTEVGIPSQIEIRSTGRYRGTETAMTVRAQWRTPASTLFNYVIFSEDSLIKESRGSQSGSVDSSCGFCEDGTNVLTTGCSNSADCTKCVNNLCADGSTGCSSADNSSCVAAGLQCVSVNNARFGADTSVSEVAGDGVTPIVQTDAGEYNGMCNGYTYCGDGYLQQPTNGSGDGYDDPLIAGLGNEQCDEGAANSNTLPNSCRKNCRIPYCGDNIVDDQYNEECDEGGATSSCTAACKWDYQPAKRMKLEFTGHSGPLVPNIPVLVHLTTANFNYGQAQFDGDDIRFKDSSDQFIPYEIETWNPVGDSYIWVKADVAVGGFLWLYYGDSQISSSGSSPQNVWSMSSDYRLVHHFATPTTFLDSTSSGINGMGDSSGSGVVGLGLTKPSGNWPTLDQSAADTFWPGIVGPTKPITTSIWMRHNTLLICESGNYPCSTFAQAFGYDYSCSFGTGYRPFSFYTEGGLGFFMTGCETEGIWATVDLPYVTNNVWHQITSVYDGVNGAQGIQIYVDGVEQTITDFGGVIAGMTPSPTFAVPDLIQTFEAGLMSSNYNGALDELRVSSVARDADYILTDYKSVKDQLLTYGVEECLLNCPL